MAGLKVICVGKARQPFAKEGVAFYEKRLTPFFPLQTVSLRAAGHSGRSSEATVRAESDAILKQIPDGDVVVLLDEKGRQPTSRELADLMRRHLKEKGGGLTFVVGGAYGVDNRVKSRADETIGLSRLTFPHQLVRVILLEQLYRAASLLAGHAYHHD